MKQKRFCVYTSLIGGYEKLNEQPVASRSGIDFFCLTDDPHLTSKSWKIIKIDPTFRNDPFRSQRVVKLTPHDYFAEYKFSLYIDNSVVLLVKPEDIFEAYKPELDFILPTHSYRETVLDEFKEVKRLGLADWHRLNEQLAHYRKSDAGSLSERPYWAGLQIRDHSSIRVRHAMRIWLANVLRYGRRDQLSANYAFRQAGITPYRLDICNYSSWFHTWPIVVDRNEAMRIEFRSPRHRLRSLVRNVAGSLSLF